MGQFSLEKVFIGVLSAKFDSLPYRRAPGYQFPGKIKFSSHPEKVKALETKTHTFYVSTHVISLV